MKIIKKLAEKYHRKKIMKWSVLTLIGADQTGIVAAVTDVLYKNGCSLAQASMMRLGTNFAIMLRVSHNADKNLSQVLNDVCSNMGLHLHIDEDNADQTEKVLLRRSLRH